MTAPALSWDELALACGVEPYELLAHARDLAHRAGLEPPLSFEFPDEIARELRRWLRTNDRSRAAPLARPVGLTLRSLADAHRNPPTEPDELVQGLLRRAELCVVGAPRAIGKSWLALQLALLLGRGHGRFLGHLPVVRPARVLIAQGEMDAWGTYRRWRRLLGNDPIPANVFETFDRWRIRVTKIRSLARFKEGSETHEHIDAVLDDRVERTIVEHGIDVLIIDPWAVYYAGAENSNDETEAALDKLRDVAMRTGCALVILHHPSKALDVREPEDAWRGASRLADWASTRVTLLPHYTDAQAERIGLTRQQARRYVDVRFLRRHEPTDDFAVVLDAETGWWARWRPDSSGTPSGGRPRLDFNPIDVRDACRDAGGVWPSLRAAARTLDVGHERARRLLDAAIRAGHLETYPAAGTTGYRIPEPQLLTDEDPT